MLVLTLIVIISLVSCQTESQPNTELNEVDSTTEDNTYDFNNNMNDDKEVKENEGNTTERGLEVYNLVSEDLDIDYNGKILNYNMSKEDIVDILGEPLEKMNYEGADNIVTFKYNGVEITFVQEYIDVLYVKGDNYQTYRGINVGDSIDKVIENYGEVKPLYMEDEAKYYMYVLSKDIIEIQLFFVTKDNKVTEYYFCNSL